MNRVMNRVSIGRRISAIFSRGKRLMHVLLMGRRRAAGAGVSESIIMGIPVPCGTGMTKLVYAPPTHAQPMRRPDPLLQSY